MFLCISLSFCRFSFGFFNVCLVGSLGGHWEHGKHGEHGEHGEHSEHGVLPSGVPWCFLAFPLGFCRFSHGFFNVCLVGSLAEHGEHGKHGEHGVLPSRFP